MSTLHGLFTTCQTLRDLTYALYKDFSLVVRDLVTLYTHSTRTFHYLSEYWGPYIRTLHGLFTSGQTLRDLIYACYMHFLLLVRQLGPYKRTLHGLFTTCQNLRDLIDALYTDFSLLVGHLRTLHTHSTRTFHYLSDT